MLFSPGPCQSITGEVAGCNFFRRNLQDAPFQGQRCELMNRELRHDIHKDDNLVDNAMLVLLVLVTS